MRNLRSWSGKESGFAQSRNALCAVGESRGTTFPGLMATRIGIVTRLALIMLQGMFTMFSNELLSSGSHATFPLGCNRRMDNGL